MRVLHYRVSPDENGLRAEQFLLRHDFTRPLLIPLKKTEGLLLCNDAFCRLNRILQTGDVITVTLPPDKASDTVIPNRLPLNIIYEDEDILVVNKPAGMPIHPSRLHPDISLANALAWYYKEQGVPFVFRCNNRLDRDTSGLTVVAKNPLSGAILSSMAVTHDIQRQYLAISRSKPDPVSGTIRAPLARKPGPVIERMVDFENGEPAVTHYRLLASKNGFHLISLILETGRTHQIRIHLKHIGCPLIGDYLYNPDMEQIKRQALHAYCLSFLHPVTKKPLRFFAPLPDDMKHVLKSG